jgi:Short C-terminal domain
VRSGRGRGRHGPGLLGATGGPAVLPGSPAPVSGAVSARAPAVGDDQGVVDGRPHEGIRPGQQRVEVRQGRWLPRHQPWNAASLGTGRSMDDLSTQLDQLDELKQAGFLTDDEFARRRARLLAAH